MLRILVTYTMKPGMREEFLRCLQANRIRETVLREEGCLGYDYYRSVQDEDILLLVEHWSNSQAQQLHLTQPHMALVREAKDAYVADTSLETSSISDGK